MTELKSVKILKRSIIIIYVNCIPQLSVTNAQAFFSNVIPSPRFRYTSVSFVNFLRQITSFLFYLSFPSTHFYFKFTTFPATFSIFVLFLTQIQAFLIVNRMPNLSTFGFLCVTLSFREKNAQNGEYTDNRLELNKAFPEGTPK